MTKVNKEGDGNNTQFVQKGEDCSSIFDKLDYTSAKMGHFNHNAAAYSFFLLFLSQCQVFYLIVLGNHYCPTSTGKFKSICIFCRRVVRFFLATLYTFSTSKTNGNTRKCMCGLPVILLPILPSAFLQLGRPQLQLRTSFTSLPFTSVLLKITHLCRISTLAPCFHRWKSLKAPVSPRCHAAATVPSS